MQTVSAAATAVAERGPSSIIAHLAENLARAECRDGAFDALDVEQDGSPSHQISDSKGRSCRRRRRFWFPGLN